ncbi:hypothetical protein [Actinoplanes sp. NPDC026623]|uniref:hypothetical protein n=1 Tax=Actinoplanes sp. NPDC026623 TaxID=3155610 RepID=UPI0033FE0EE0
MPTQTRRAGGFLLWFAVLGGALAWTVHVFVAWGVDELTCRAGNTSVGGVPVRGIVGAGVVIPALVTLAALLLAWRGWRRATAATRDHDSPRMQRTGMLLLIGLGADALFLAIILAGGAAVLVLSPCQ